MSLTFLNTCFSIEENGHYYPRTVGGYNTLIPPSKFKEIVSDLVHYCVTYTDEDIERYNITQVKDFLKENEPYMGDIERKTSNGRDYPKGYVYMLKCADKYKIGYSNNVEKRIKQLDVRPFKLELVFKIYSDNAYHIEQIIHSQLEPFKEEGEWYNNQLTEEYVKTLIDENIKLFNNN